MYFQIKNPTEAIHNNNVIAIYFGPNAGNGLNPHGVPSFKKNEKLSIQTHIRYKIKNEITAKAIMSFFSALNFNFI